MKLSPNLKYALPLFISTSSYYCTQTAYFTFDSRFSPDYDNLLPTVQFLFNFLLITPLIFGYIIDYIGVIHVLIPLNVILILGQALYTVGWWNTNYWILSSGFFLITLAAESLIIAKWVFIANTFIPKKITLSNKTKDTSGYSKLVLYSIIVDMIFILIPLLAAKKFSIISGCVFAVVGLVAAFFTAIASFAKENKETFQIAGWATNALSGMGVSLLSEENNDFITEEELETQAHLNNKRLNLSQEDSPRFARVWRRLSVFVIAGLFGYCLFEFVSKSVANQIHDTFTNILGQFPHLLSGIIPSTALIFSSILLARTRLGKTKLEHMMVWSGGLLLLSTLINMINTEATDIISISLYIASLLANPYLLPVYLPHIVEYDLRCFGFVCGLYLWPKNILNLLMLMANVSYYQDYDEATKAAKNPLAYWTVMVGIPILALVLGLIFLYGEKIRRKKRTSQIEDNQPENLRPNQSQSEN